MPRNPKKWIEEIRKAYADARDSIPFCRLVDPTFGESELFHLAASIAVKFRGLRSDEKTLEQATEAALITYVANIAEQKETLTDPRLAFALCYLASHYGLELVGTATIEDVMALAVQHRELIAPSGEEPGLQFGMKR